MKSFAVLLLIVLTGCTDQPKNKTESLRIGLVTWVGYGPFYIAEEKGFFRRNNVAVDLQRVEGDVERRAAIASGRLDGIALTLDAMIVLRAHGIPLKTVMAIDTSNGGDGIVAEHSIKTVEDLKGKQVAFPPGLPSHFLLYSVLKHHGLSISDLKPVPMDADKAGSTFAAGKIEAAVTWEPWLSRASEVGRGHVLANSKEFPGLIEDVLFFREDVIEMRRADINGVIKSWFEAVNFVTSNPAEAREIIGRAFNLSPEKVSLLLTGIRYEDKARNKEAFGDAHQPGFLYPLYDRIGEAWLKEKVITKRDSPRDGIDPSFVRAIQ